MFSPREEAEKKGGKKHSHFPPFFPFSRLNATENVRKKKLGKEKKEKDPLWENGFV